MYRHLWRAAEILLDQLLPPLPVQRAQQRLDLHLLTNQIVRIVVWTQVKILICRCLSFYEQMRFVNYFVEVEVRHHRTLPLRHARLEHANVLDDFVVAILFGLLLLRHPSPRHQFRNLVVIVIIIKDITELWLIERTVS